MKRRLTHLTYLLHLTAAVVLVITGWPTQGQGQQVMKSFPTPGSDPRGLAWDGQYLWCSDSAMDLVYQIDPQDGRVISSFKFALDLQYGGLAWSPDGYIWISDFRSNQSYYYKVDAATAQIKHMFHCPGG